jgi:transposase
MDTLLSLPPAATLHAENLALKERVGSMAERIAVLQNQIEWFKRKLFGGGQSEKLARVDVAQLELAMAELEQLTLPVSKTETITYERAKPSPEKRAVPAETFANLPVRETIVIEPAAVQAAPEAFEKIGEERTFEVDVVPPKLFKREIVRPKYRRKDDRTVAPVIAPAPARPVPGGYASAGLLAWIAISKFQDHLPLYRLQQMSARWGATLSRQSMVDWIRITAEWCEPIYKRMLADLLQGNYVQADETPVRYNDPDEPRTGTFQGYLWVLSRPGGDVVFDWRLSRRHAELTTLLTGHYRGLLQSDGYEAYAAYVRTHPGVIWLGCWAHARRAFFEAQSENPRVVVAFLRLIARLYRREREWDEQKLSAEERTQKRMAPDGLARTMQSLRRLASWVQARVLPQSLLGKACTYLLNQWEPLSAHLRHGQSRLDNNLIENAIRPSCIGKKNWLFIGHPDAGQRSAILYSMIVSCQRHGKDPLAYLRDILTRLPGMKNSDDLAPLLPCNWAPPSEPSAAPA